MKLLVPSLLVLGLAAFAAQAKMPPLSPEAQAKADEAKAKTAWTEKVAAYQLCKSMDRVAESYFKRVKASPQAPKAAAAASAAPAVSAASAATASASAPGTPVATAPCTDPGPFTAASAAASKPLEAAGAHSPPATAATPPSNKATQNEMQGPAKSK